MGFFNALNNSEQSSSIWEFQHDGGLGSTFDPTFTKNSGQIRCEIGDGSLPIASNIISETLLSSGTLTCKIITSKYEDIIGFNAPSDSLRGILDFTGWNNCSTWVMNGTGNPDIAQVIFPTTAIVTNTIDIGATGGATSITTLDLSTFSNLSGDIDFQNSNSLTSLTLPSSNPSGSISELNFGSCDLLTGSIDLSGLKFASGATITFNSTSITGFSFPIESNIAGPFTSIQIQSTNISGALDASVLGDNIPNTWRMNNTQITSITMPTTSTICSRLQLQVNNITGTLDISGLTGLQTYFACANNSGISGLLLPINSNSFTTFDINSCSISGTIDFSSTLSGPIDAITLHSNSITSVTFANNSNVMNQLRLHSNNLTGNLDLSPLSSLAGDFRVDGNPNLTSITNPTSSGSLDEYYAYNCDLSGTLDMSNLSALAGDFRVDRNPNLTSITNPTSSGVFTNYYAYSCDLNYISFIPLSGSQNDGIDIDIKNNNMLAEDVNHILVDLDNIGWVSGTLDISGTNEAPNDTSGSFNGNIATGSLLGKSWILTTS